jgi:phenylpropionate dioxygenase-like ring-hydroxylating dioxygenase large terminal subunit
VAPGPQAADNTTAGLERSWYAVALADEVGDGPLAVSVLGVPWVVARLSGRLVAFEDRCPHRLAPLSIGTVCGATLQCRYHGWRYDGDGRCVDIPSLGPGAAIPSRARLRRAAGVEERYGLVWLAPAEPVAPIPDFGEWDDPRFATHWNVPRRTIAAAVQLCENFLDASHLPTVHTTTIGVADAGYLPPHTVEVDGHRAWTTYQVMYANHADPLVATGEHPLEQPQVLYKELCPATTVVMRLVFPVTGRTLAILFSCLPETATSTRVFKMMARDDVTPGAPELVAIEEFQDRVLDEDLAVLEPFARHEVPLDLRTEVHTRADQLAVAYRRVLARLVAGPDASRDG